MLIPKVEAVELLEKTLKVNYSETEILKTQIESLRSKFNIPEMISQNILTLRTSASDETEFILYCIMSVVNADLIEKCFTAIEIEEFSKQRYKEHKVKFPLKFKAVQVAPNQWLTTISVKEMMSLRNSQLIRYDEDTQRTVQHMVSGTMEYWTISVNRTQVENIEQALKDGTYIPDTLTFNIPENTEYDFSDGILTIKSIDFFSVIDGYHRYLAMSNVYNIDQNFDLTTELRIVQFSKVRSRQFIWQQDQKVKMNKIESDSFNTVDKSNQVVDLVIQACNESPVLNGIITRHSSKISVAVLAEIIRNHYYTKTSSKITYNAKYNFEVRNEIVDMLTKAFEENMDIYDSSVDNLTLYTMFIAYKYIEDDTKTLLEKTNKLLELSKESKLFTGLYNKICTNRFVKAYK